MKQGRERRSMEEIDGSGYGRGRLRLNDEEVRRDIETARRKFEKENGLGVRVKIFLSGKGEEHWGELLGYVRGDDINGRKLLIGEDITHRKGRLVLSCLPMSAEAQFLFAEFAVDLAFKHKLLFRLLESNFEGRDYYRLYRLKPDLQRMGR